MWAKSAAPSLALAPEGSPYGALGDPSGANAREGAALFPPMVLDAHGAPAEPLGTLGS